MANSEIARSVSINDFMGGFAGNTKKKVRRKSESETTQSVSFFSFFRSYNK